MDLYEDSISYNSFIIGSSRSDFYYIDSWKKHLDSSSVCFHFNQSGDNLYGMLQRVNYLYNRFDHIDNLLIIIDHELLADTTPNKGPLFVAPYQVTPERDFLSFHWEFIRTFFSFNFQMEYWSRSNTINGYYIPTYNELHKPIAEEEIAKDPSHYYSSLPKDYSLYPRDSIPIIGDQVILEKQKTLLYSLCKLINNGGTSYKVIVSPLYDQIKLSPKDSLYLSSLFYDDCFFDFSGINEFTEDTLNYYENSHYRPSLCERLLDIVYH